MARRPKSHSPEESGHGEATNREKIIEAYFGLLAERPFEEIGLGDIAARAGVSLAEFRAEFGSAFAIIAAQVKEIDRQVLAGGDNDMAEEPPRERLFDVLMRRIEALQPHKAAIKSLMRSARFNPPLALALNQLGVRSQQWMLTAADINAQGTAGMLRAQGLAVLFASVLRIWVDDDDPAMARTMAALDRALARGGRWAALLNDLCRFAPSRFFGRRRRADAGGAERREGPGEASIPI